MAFGTSTYSLSKYTPVDMDSVPKRPGETTSLSTVRGRGVLAPEASLSFAWIDPGGGHHDSKKSRKHQSISSIVVIRYSHGSS